jgi:HSP20 family protein
MRKNTMKAGALLLTALIIGGATVTYAADDTKALKEEIKRLNQRIVQLERQLEQRSDPDYIDVWDPFMQMNHMRQRMMSMVDEHEFFNPRIDIKESPKKYTITMDIPGMDKNNIEVTVKENNLIISGERTSSKEEKSQDKFFRQERSFGHFVRALPLPQDADVSTVDAKYENGVLTIDVNRLEKSPAKAAQKITVK